MGTKHARELLLQTITEDVTDSMENKKHLFQQTVQELFHNISAKETHSTIVQKILSGSKEIQTMTAQVDLDKDAEELR